VTVGIPVTNVDISPRFDTGTSNYLCQPLQYIMSLGPCCAGTKLFPPLFLLFFIAIKKKKETDEEGEAAIIRKPWTAAQQLRKFLRY